MRHVYLITLFIRIFSPVTNIVAWVVRAFLKLFGIDISKVKSGSHLEILRGAIDMHHGPKEETNEQRIMLRSILDLFEVTVSDIMIHRQNVHMIDCEQPLHAIISDILKSGYSRLPVWKGRPENIVGMVHMRLLLKELHDNGGDISKVDLASVILEPWFIPETTSLFDQLQAFRERKEHFATVLDEYGTFMGIVTLEDILEEIVGEIDDEVDENVPGVKRGKGGSYLVEGGVTIRDLNREFDWHLPDDNYSTVAGLVLYESETIPDIGQVFSFHNLKFEVLKRKRNRITRIRIMPPKTKKKSKAAKS
jgi:Mg2+/Co2+ transporter CorB